MHVRTVVIDGKKKCTKCGLLLALNFFSKEATNTTGRRSACRECEKNYKLKLRYNLSDKELDNFLLQSECEICNISFSSYGSGHNRHKCLDHDHETGEARGILCNACNSALGYFQDKPEIIMKAVKYLQNNGSAWRAEDINST